MGDILKFENALPNDAYSGKYGSDNDRLQDRTPKPINDYRYTVCIRTIDWVKSCVLNPDQPNGPV